MSGLLLIVTECQSERFAAAAELAATKAALAQPVAVLFRGDSLAAIAGPTADDALNVLRDMGVALYACQTALAAHDLRADDLPPGIEASGMVAFLRGRGDWQILLV